MNDLSRRIAELPPDQRARLEARLQVERPGRAPGAPIPRRAPSAASPLSFAQQRLWFLDQLDPGKPYDNLPVVWRLRGALDVPALTRALDVIVARHEALRTTFVSREGEPAQVVGAARRVAVERRDLSGRAEGKELALSRIFAEELGRPFDLARDLMVRAVLVREAEGSHLLVLMMHHIASDGWSVGVLRRELAELYGAAVSGREAKLPDLAIQYADFAVWQRQWLAGERLASQLAYWKRRLGGELPILELPADRPRRAEPSLEGSAETRILPKSLRDRLEALSREEGVSLYMTLLAGLEVMLARWSGTEEVLVGTPIAGRNRTETEGLIGCFVNTLVMRGDVSGNPTFREHLGRVREAALGAYAHQDLPFEKLVSELRPDRRSVRSPIFQVMFSLESEDVRPPAFPGLSVEELELGTMTSAHELSVDVMERGGGLQVSAEYRKELFDEGTIERFLEGYERLLEGAVEEAGERVWQLPVMSQRQRGKVLELGEGPAAQRGGERGVDELFERQARQRPEAVAVESGGERVTYGQLEKRASALARRLASLGVRGGERVGICVERGVELAVALLGAMKAGAVYVPVEASQPEARVRFYLEDSGATVVVTQKSRAGLVEGGGWKTVLMEEVGEEPSGSVERAGGGQEAAYILYTSGSTGRPKGVVVTHGGLLNHARAIVKRYGMSEKDRVLQFASVSFDVAGEEIYPTWAAGGTVVMRGEGSVGIEEFEEEIERRQPTVMNLPAGFWHEWVGQMARRGRAKVPGSLRLLVTGSDRVMRERLEWWKRQVPQVGWMNGYGPTEATITATVYEAGEGEVGGTGSVPIGKPLEGVRVRVVDREGGLCPMGVAGELWIGGEGVAQGYWGLEEMTKEKFLQDPWAEPGQRVYRTGDRVRQLSDGNLEFLGRQDGQVKVRGYRIEPGEIEAALEEQEGVREAAVVAWREGEETRLVGYVAPEGVSTERLKEELKKRLPGYMVPWRVMALEALPRTESGKLDRRRLPEPGQGRAAVEEGYVAPQTPVEEGVARIWEELLRREPIGVKDNFFDLGGHSLLATQVISRLREAFSVELPLKTLFESATVGELALAVAQAQAQQTSPEELERLLEGIEEEGQRPTA